MRFIIYGAGGIGGVIGAQLALNGRDVVLIARGNHLQAIQEWGLTYQTPHRSEVLDILAIGHPGEIDFRVDDVVLLTMKSQHTRAALDDLYGAAGDEIPVICCQNGVANERAALRRFRRVYAMLVYLPANALEPGVVQTHALETIGVLDAGVYPQGTDDLIAEVTGALTAARFSAVPNPTVLRFKYAKLLMNLGNAISAVSPPGEAATEIRRQLQAEGRACLDAAGIDLASREEVRERRGELIRMGEIDGQGRQFGSSWQSLTRGTGDIEADYLNGEIVLLGRLHGVPTPANAVLQRLANTLAREHAPAQSIPLAELQRRISAEASG